MINSAVGLKGSLTWRVFKTIRRAPLAWKLHNMFRWSYIRGEFAWYIGRPLARLLGLMTVMGELRAIKQCADGTFIDYGLLGHRVVTTAFCVFMVDQHQTDTTEVGDFKYHDSGVGTTAEANGDTGIETTDGESRATGTQTEGSSVQYRSVGTISYTTTKAITEHGLFSTAASTTLMDRTVFTAINVVNGDSIQFTYTITYTAGG